MAGRRPERSGGPFAYSYRAFALVLTVISLISIVYYNPQLAVIFTLLGALGGAATWYRLRRSGSRGEDALLVQRGAQAGSPEGGAERSAG